MRLDGEFGTLTEVAAELGLDPAVIPQVSRRLAAAGPGQACSVVRWGSAEPELVFLHGGGQNARTWDLVALDLGRPRGELIVMEEVAPAARGERDSPVELVGVDRSHQQIVAEQVMVLALLLWPH